MTVGQLSAQVTYDTVDFGLPSGTLWAGSNIGTSQSHQSGTYFSWGECSAFHGTYSYVLELQDDLVDSNDAAVAATNGLWRMPTAAEFEELMTHTTQSKGTVGGVNGVVFKGKDGNQASMFIPYSGYKCGILSDDGSISGSDYLYLWTRSVVPNTPSMTRYFRGNASILGVKLNLLPTIDRAFGYAIRPVLNRTYYMLSLPEVEGGHVVGVEEGRHIVGDSLWLSVVTDSGWVFVSWQDGNTDMPRGICPSGDTVMTPVFVRTASKLTLMTYDSIVLLDTLVPYGDSLHLPDIPRRAGYVATGWSVPIPEVMPGYNIVAVAQYEHNFYHVEWSDTADRVYDGHDFNVQAWFFDDDNQRVFLQVSYFIPEAQASLLAIRDAHDYRLQAGLDDPNYLFDASASVSITISPKQLHVSGAVVNTVKLYDSSAVATFKVEPTLVGVCDPDEVTLVANAWYDTSAVGDSNTITIHYIIQGEDAANYLAPVDSVIYPCGIVRPLTEEMFMQAGGLQPQLNGYCGGELGVIVCPNVKPFDFVAYKLIFDADEEAQGFVSSDDWESFDGTNIYFEVPEGVAAGEYMVRLQVLSDIGIISDTISCELTMNIPAEYVVAIFNDVVSVNQRYLHLDSYQWYRDGIPQQDATLPYLHQPYGMDNHSYYVTGVKDGYPVRSCPRSDLAEMAANLLNAFGPAFSFSPNPVSDNVFVHVTQSAPDATHQVSIVDSQGGVRKSATFVGATCNVNVASLSRGVYNIVVDGCAKTLVKAR